MLEYFTHVSSHSVNEALRFEVIDIFEPKPT